MHIADGDLFLYGFTFWKLPEVLIRTACTIQFSCFLPTSSHPFHRCQCTLCIFIMSWQAISKYRNVTLGLTLLCWFELLGLEQLVCLEFAERVLCLFIAPDELLFVGKGYQIIFLVDEPTKYLSHCKCINIATPIVSFEMQIKPSSRLN